MKRSISLLIILIMSSSLVRAACPAECGAGDLTTEAYGSPDAYPSILGNPNFEVAQMPTDMLNTHISRLNDGQIRNLNSGQLQGLTDQNAINVVNSLSPNQVAQLRPEQITAILNSNRQLTQAQLRNLRSEQLAHGNNLETVGDISNLNSDSLNGALDTLHPGDPPIAPIDVRDVSGVTYRRDDESGLLIHPNFPDGLDITSFRRPDTQLILAVQDEGNTNGFVIVSRDSIQSIIADTPGSISSIFRTSDETGPHTYVRTPDGNTFELVDGRVISIQVEGGTRHELGPSAMVSIYDVLLVSLRESRDEPNPSFIYFPVSRVLPADVSIDSPVSVDLDLSGGVAFLPPKATVYNQDNSILMSSDGQAILTYLPLQAIRESTKLRELMDTRREDITDRQVRDAAASYGVGVALTYLLGEKSYLGYDFDTDTVHGFLPIDGGARGTLVADVSYSIPGGGGEEGAGGIGFSYYTRLRGREVSASFSGTGSDFGDPKDLDLEWAVAGKMGNEGFAQANVKWNTDTGEVTGGISFVLPLPYD